MSDIENTIFKEFVDHDCDDYRLYLDVMYQVKSENHKACGELSVIIYDQLRLLMNSVNNAGWQGRHSEHIQMITNLMVDISREYGEFLP